jgi:hypothetical protein
VLKTRAVYHARIAVFAWERVHAAKMKRSGKPERFVHGVMVF